MDSVEREVSIRKLRAEDADEISEIYSLITKKPAHDDFRKLVREHVLKEEHEAHFVAAVDGTEIELLSLP